MSNKESSTVKHKYPEIYEYNPISMANKKDLVWIEFKPLEITKQTMNVRDTNKYLQTVDVHKAIKLLAPMDIQENITHNWVDYENMIGRAGQLLSKYYKGARSIGSTGLNAAKAVKEGKINEIINANIQAETSSSISTPLIYEGSNRKEYTMMFQLADQGNPKLDVLAPVQYFREHSSAEIKNHITIKYPHIFSVKSIGSTLIDIKYAAIIAVQPNFQGPYRSGFPSRCELSISIRDMTPLFLSSWKGGAGGKVSTKILVNADTMENAVTNAMKVFDEE